MIFGDTLDSRHEGDVCVVCGKALKPGEAVDTMHNSGSKLPICCPLCLEAYQKDPKSYLERLAKRTFQQELRNLTRSKAET